VHYTKLSSCTMQGNSIHPKCYIHTHPSTNKHIYEHLVLDLMSPGQALTNLHQALHADRGCHQFNAPQTFLTQLLVSELGSPENF